MPTRSTDRLPAAFAPVLTPQFLNLVQQLNLDFLQLLLDAPGPSPCAHLEACPVTITQALRNLPPASLQLLSTAPHALYTLGFDDQDFWLNVLGSSEPRVLRVADSGAAACRMPRHTEFCERVIFFAWHVAVDNHLAARVMFGMPAAVNERLQATPFWRLQQVMRACPWLLSPRWPANPRFWPDLVRCATLGNAAGLHHTQLLGSQLIAAELRLAESPGELAGRARAVRTTQLLRWKARQRG